MNSSIRKGTRFIAVFTALAVMIAMMPFIGDSAYAASQTPEVPGIKYVSATGNIITVRWSKSEGADKYQIAERSAGKSWKYLKTVKKTSANKKKYTAKSKYKVVISGKYYKVYKYRYSYFVRKTTSALNCEFTGKYTTKYRLVVRACRGKYRSSWSETVSITSGKKTIFETITLLFHEDDSELTKKSKYRTSSDWKYVSRKIIESQDKEGKLPKITTSGIIKADKDNYRFGTFEYTYRNVKTNAILKCTIILERDCSESNKKT